MSLQPYKLTSLRDKVERKSEDPRFDRMVKEVEGEKKKKKK